ncbi:MAG TPA: tRNA (N6-threonylcarbamoyladenosine(37)-N6)-methyltransferase TrmO [Streptosporangiaceae bacterium]|nr:tRNA (N6-threonylcarbamoyladenosine(37)-N6)-methyltransferase TrmO [Streptosporangiaceae bacterium]
MRQNQPAPAENVPLAVIGVVRSAHTEPETTPIQAALNRAGRGTIEIAEPYREGLAGLDGFGYAWLLTWLHRPGGSPAGEPDGHPPLRQVPYLLRSKRREMGIFATRGPRRVNPIGLSLIQLLSVTAEAVVFAGVDVLDGTPVIDLKPYVTRFDRPPGDPPCGWFDDLAIGDGSTPAGLGPSAP